MVQGYKILPFLRCLALMVMVCHFSAGCASEKDAPAPDPAKEEARLKTALKIRSYYDRAGGNYDALSAEDKVALAKIVGGESKAREVFDHMSNPNTKISNVGGGPIAPPDTSGK